MKIFMIADLERPAMVSRIRNSESPEETQEHLQVEGLSWSVT